MTKARKSRNPVMSAASLWIKRVEGVLRFLESVKGSASVRGSAWGEGNVRYYRKHLEQLLASPPKGCQAKLKGFRSRLRKV